MLESLTTAAIAALLIFASSSVQGYGFYMLLRLATSLLSVYWAFRNYQEGEWGWSWPFIFLALLVNPFIPIRMQRADWQPIDLCFGVLLLVWSAYRCFRRPRTIEGEPRANVVDSNIRPSAVSPRSDRGLPDLGKHLASTGIPQNTLLIYTSWHMAEFSVKRSKQYCVSCIQAIDGTEYCATFDFGSKIMREILLRAPNATKCFIEATLAKDPAGIRHERLPTAIMIGVAAKLGNLQQGLNETFIPLEILEVFENDAERAELYQQTVDANMNLYQSEVQSSKVSAASVSLDDVHAISAYCLYLAKRWWSDERRGSAACDACNELLICNDGFLNESSLFCSRCFEPSADPETALINLREDPDHYGDALLDNVRLFMRCRQ